MLRWFARLLPTEALKPMMSEVGASIYDLMESDAAEWERDSGHHTLEESKSGIVLWIATGYSFFKLWRVKHTGIAVDDAELAEMLNAADLCVLWRCYQDMDRKYNLKHQREIRTTVANVARLALMKDNQP